MYKEDLALNNQKLLICHKTQPNQTKPSFFSLYDKNIALTFTPFIFQTEIEIVEKT